MGNLWFCISWGGEYSFPGRRGFLVVWGFSVFWGAWEKVICWFGIRGRLGDCSWLQIMKVFKFDVIYRFYVTCALGIIWGGDGFES